jgi:molecular chaperone DnaJ
VPDHYETLGVTRDADAATIKSAYRRLALRYHPDRNNGDPEAEERFKAINAAYAVLSDDARRARYDRYGDADAQAVFTGDIFDVFASVFGGGMVGRRGQRQRGMAGEDLEVELTVTLEEARDGAASKVEVERFTVCDHCSGERSEPGGQGRRRCDTCGGAGQVRAQAQSFFGTVVTAQTCPSCRGLGEIIVTPCSVCRGAGRRPERATVSVPLPKGIDGGYRLRVPREGNVGVDGGPTGDLYVYVEMLPHPQLQRDGDDLRSELRIGFAQAALGSCFEVPTLDGPELIEIAPGTQNGTEVRLRGKGMPRLRQVGTGDQVVRVVVETPRRLSKRARALLEEYADEVGEVLEGRETLAERIKGFFAGRRRSAAGSGEVAHDQDDAA